MKAPQIDYKQLTPEQRDKLESYKQTQEQLQTLQDIADIVQEMLGVLDTRVKNENTTSHNIGVLLTDMRNALQELNGKETPETPDHAKPVVEAVDKLEKSLTKAIKSIDVKPVIDAPQVNVSPPSVDLKGVEKAVQWLAKSFEQAIKLIPTVELPETDNSELLAAWEGISEQLVSIENATRMKTQAPTTMKVTNPDGSSIGSLAGSTYYQSFNDTTTDTNLVYLGKAVAGSDATDAAWQIKRYNKSAGTMTFADDITTFTKQWSGRTGYTY